MEKSLRVILLPWSSFFYNPVKQLFSVQPAPLQVDFGFYSRVLSAVDGGSKTWLCNLLHPVEL